MNYPNQHDTGITEDNIEISLPINAAYVSAARLTASSIANRIGFDVDEIEDVKAAVSEACNYIIRHAPSNNSTLFKIVFRISGKTLNIALECRQKFLPVNINEEMGLLMIRALMDEMEISSADSAVFFVKMCKSHTSNMF